MKKAIKVDISKLPQSFEELGITREELFKMPHKEYADFMISKGFPKEWFDVKDAHKVSALYLDPKGC